jgi:mycothiol system anti-sigma-R factor
MDEQDNQETASSSGGGDDYSWWFAKSGCQEAIHTLYNFLDGELTEQRRQEIALHLHECSPCLDAFDFEAELKLVIARKCRDQVPEALRQRVYRALLDASGGMSGGEYRWE